MKQLILKLDEQANHSIVLEDLDEYRILVVEPQVTYLREQLEILLEENTYAAGQILAAILHFILTIRRSDRRSGDKERKGSVRSRSL